MRFCSVLYYVTGQSHGFSTHHLVGSLSIEFVLRPAAPLMTSTNTHIPTHPHSTVGLNKQRRRWLGCYRCCRLSRVTLFSPSGGQQRVPTEGRTCGIDDTFPDSCACCISLHLCVLPSWSTYIGRALLLRLPDTVIKTYDTCKLLQP